MSVDAINQLRATVAQHVEGVQRVALASAAGGGPEWDAVLQQYQLPGVGPAERGATATALGIERGAVPAEVLMALEALARWAQHHLAAQGGDAALSAELQGLPAREVARYRSQLVCRPSAAASATPAAAPAAAAPPGLASIFQNAAETTQQAPWANRKREHAVLSCRHCGAPQEEIDNFLCGYCCRPLGS